MTGDVPAGRPHDAGAPGKAQRLLVAGALVLLLVPGLVGIDLWPLTAWKLFSLARTDRQTTWEVEAVDAGGRTTPVSLDGLPLGYQLAGWHLAQLPGADYTRRDAVCRTLLAAVAAEHPGVTDLYLARYDRQLVPNGGEWAVYSVRQILHSCGAEPA